MLTRRPSAKLAVLLGLPLALAYSAWRARREASRGDRPLFLCLAGLALQYALLESTKFFIYWIPVVPFLCVGIAGASLRLLQLAGVAGGRPAGRAPPGAPPGRGPPPPLSPPARRRRHRGTRARGLARRRRHVALVGPARERVPQLLPLLLPHARRRRALPNDDLGLPGRLRRGVRRPHAPGSELDEHLSARDLADWHGYLAEHGEKVARLEGPVAASYGYVDIWRLD